MKNGIHGEARKILARGGVCSLGDFARAGVPAWAVYRLFNEGTAQRVGRGIYTSVGGPKTENQTYVEVSKRIPKGIICLLSALRLHGLTTANPEAVWVAIDRRAWRPRIDRPQVRIVRFAGAGLTTGIERRLIEGVPVPVTDVPRTIADCFKYRNKIGLELALEALRDGWRRKRFTMDQIWRAARLCRVSRVMQPYLESLT